ncbi:MAG: hypothetical protein RIS79_1131 [Verrucomicrobiota bacterium]
MASHPKPEAGKEGANRGAERQNAHLWQLSRMH